MGRNKLPLDEKKIQRLYYKQGKSVVSIAHELGASPWAIRQRLPEVRSNISTQECKIDHELLDGLLLGDGCVRIQSRGKTPYFSFSQHTSRLGWTKQIQHEFRKFGMQTTITPMSGDRVSLWSLAYPALHPVRLRWYPQEYKVVPLDIVLTPRVLAQWFFGDGCFNIKKKYDCRMLKLSTMGFTRLDVKRLIAQLEQRYAFGAKQTASNEIALYQKESIRRFQDLVKPYAPPCLNYKLSADAYWKWRKEKENGA